MTDRVIKVGVIGAGFMGAMHARIWQQMYGVEVVGVADPDLSRSEALKPWIPQLNGYEDFNQMLEQEKPDIVSICTKDDFHLAPALAAAKVGAHIFLEKPIATTVEDGEAITRAAREANVKLGIGFLLRFDPRYSRAQEILASGSAGEVSHISARRNSPAIEGPARYGGSLPLPLHVTVHDVDMILWLLKHTHPISVYAQTTNKLLGHLGTEDSVFAIIRFADGTVVNLESSWALPAGSRTLLDAKMSILATKGLIEIECGESGLYHASENMNRYIDTQHWPLSQGELKGDLREELMAFLGDVRTGTTRVATGEEGNEALRITVAIMDSARTGEIVRV
ncbi:gfo/Idh/MocA family oxidoreductase [Yersinia pestis]|uniref:Oxidoreductase n=25 Tax=Yersinia pestis TaxID=632 RepID=A0AAX2I6M6_YERPE|nr:Gfo/Idh/MocA family oxidoreductase [Yersinia pestis]EDR30454.1 oxidoreductase, NAD-binding [Yersinia pestis biovar Orientalis str. IP275]EFA45833.1 oxidoreductase family, NAD-binding Rossmann fold protein [Yersinia pestis KIM D27]ERP74592.1 oxidoreductase [Yersinia pestis 24H]AAM85976.1 putative periplasmic solute-binding protein of ABC transporter [Yersinia pestis KIM10+]AAS61740.1 putative oxidoreductase [Yersinia pestis biovar Microtus str. 91001]